MKRLTTFLMTLALALAAPAFAKEGKGQGKGHKDDHSASELAPGKGEHGRPDFSGNERSEIEAYYGQHPLPPGLAKKNKVPPGWEKKIRRGHPVPDDLWAHRVPLPHDILVRLPPPPPGVVLVRIHDRVLKVRERTHEVLDDLGLPHPP